MTHLSPVALETAKDHKGLQRIARKTTKDCIKPQRIFATQPMTLTMGPISGTLLQRHLSVLERVRTPFYTVSQKKVPTFKLCVTFSTLNRFSQNFCTTWKLVKFATKNKQQYPPHLKHVATLPWEIKNSNFLQILSRYVKMQTNCIFSVKMQTNCIFSALILSFLRV